MRFPLAEGRDHWPPAQSIQVLVLHSQPPGLQRAEDVAVAQTWPDVQTTEKGEPLGTALTSSFPSYFYEFFGGKMKSHPIIGSRQAGDKGRRPPVVTLHQAASPPQDELDLVPLLALEALVLFSAVHVPSMTKSPEGPVSTMV